MILLSITRVEFMSSYFSEITQLMFKKVEIYCLFMVVQEIILNG